MCTSLPPQEDLHKAMPILYLCMFSLSRSSMVRKCWCALQSLIREPECSNAIWSFATVYTFSPSISCTSSTAKLGMQLFKFVIRYCMYTCSSSDRHLIQRYWYYLVHVGTLVVFERVVHRVGARHILEQRDADEINILLLATHSFNRKVKQQLLC